MQRGRVAEQRTCDCGRCEHSIAGPGSVRSRRLIVRRRRLHTRGMTLIEVLTASVLLGVGVAGLMSTATLAMRNQQKVEQRSVALCLAQEKMSEIDMIGPHVWLLGRPMSGSEERNNT